MVRDTFTALGLSADHARIYDILLNEGPLQGGELNLKMKGVKRPTVYKYAEELVAAGLVQRRRRGRAVLFEPMPPSALLEKADALVSDAERRRDDVRGAMEQMRMRYLLATEKPQMRYFDGIEELKEIYNDHLASGEDMFFVRTNRAEDYRDLFGRWWGDYLKKRAEKGIISHGITPDDPHAVHDGNIDKKLGIVRSWVNPGDYTASVELSVYGDKVAVISFGKELFGLMIEHKEIARALRDLFVLAEKGATTIEVRHEHE